MYKKIGLLCLFWIFNNIFKSSSNPNIFQNKRNIFLRVSEVLRRRNAYFSFQSIFSIQCWIIALRISRALSSRVCSLCSTITLWVKICTNNAIKGGLFVFKAKVLNFFSNTDFSRRRKWTEKKNLQHWYWSLSQLYNKCYHCSYTIFQATVHHNNT